MNSVDEIKLNCDLGEDPQAKQRDLLLLEQVDAVSIACGGHAGDRASARYWADVAAAKGKAFHLHLSYPDREHFGRRRLPMHWQALADSLSAQRDYLPHCHALKLHGALYNEAAVDEALASQLVQWCRQHAIDTLLAPPGSVLAKLAAGQLSVEAEGFADRAYCLQNGQLVLKPRSEAGAVHRDPALVIAQIQSVLQGAGLPVDDHYHAFECDTWCIHSDSEGALAMLESIRRQWPLKGSTS